MMEHTSESMAKRTKPALLIIDDTAADIDTLVASLGGEYTIRVATDGVAALRSAEDRPPDMILLDVMMPVMDGFEVCRRLKQDPALRDIPVIFLTAVTGDGDEAFGLGLGAVDYITKPFSAAIVQARVCNQLELRMHRAHLEVLVNEKSHELAESYRRFQDLSRSILFDDLSVSLDGRSAVVWQGSKSDA